jgi:hypothetical protein
MSVRGEYVNDNRQVPVGDAGLTTHMTLGGHENAPSEARFQTVIPTSIFRLMIYRERPLYIAHRFQAWDLQIHFHDSCLTLPNEHVMSHLQGLPI